MRTSIALTSALSVLILAGVACAPITTQFDYDKREDFSSLKSFDFLPAPNASSVNPFIVKRIKEATTRGEADLFYLSWWADYSDPENFLFPLFHSSNFGSAGNRTRYSNPIVDVLIEKGQNVLDRKRRESYYMQAEKIIVDDAPWVFLWHRNEYIVRNPWVKNLKTYPIYSMDKGTEIMFQAVNPESDR